VLLAAEVLLLTLHLLHLPFLWKLFYNITAVAVVKHHPSLHNSVRPEGREPWSMHMLPVLPQVQLSFRCQFRT